MSHYLTGTDVVTSIGGDDAATAGGIISKLLETAGNVVSKVETVTAAKKKAAERDDAISKAKGARKNADAKRAEANAAKVKAEAEKEPDGPLHKAAAEAERLASLYEADARTFEAKAALLSGEKPSGGESYKAPKSGGMPVWGWVLGGVAVLTGGVLIIRKSRK